MVVVGVVKINVLQVDRYGLNKGRLGYAVHFPLKTSHCIVHSMNGHLAVQLSSMRSNATSTHFSPHTVRCTAIAIFLRDAPPARYDCG